MSCPEIERVLGIIRPENRETWSQVYDLCYRAVCTPSLNAPVALDILIDRMIELGQWSSFRSVSRARQVAYAYACRRCGMPTLPTPQMKQLPRTEWQCAGCAHVNEQRTALCDECGATYAATRERDRADRGERT